MTAAKKSLSQPQIEALLEGVHHELVRAAADWIYSEKVKHSDTVSLLIIKRFRLSTIRSLHRRGLMSANSDDPCLHHAHYGDKCSTWLREDDHPARPLVWTSSLGCALLCEKGLLPKNLVDDVIPSAIADAKLRRPTHLKKENGIVDLAAYRENRNLTVDRIISSRSTGHPYERRYEGRDIVLVDKELKRFHDWLQSKGEHASVLLALRWISEFELYAEKDEGELRELKALAKKRSNSHSDAATALEFIRWVEDTAEPDPLKQFHDWLQLKVGDRTAALTRWWLGEFRDAEEDDGPFTGPSPTLH